MSEWISVKERLPEHGQVIAFSPQYKEYMIGYLDESSVEGIFCHCDGVELYQVTHWQPLPEPPGEEGDSGASDD